MPKKVQSAAPYEVRPKRYMNRLNEPFRYSWPEQLIARMWEARNVRSFRANHGVSPVDYMPHECSESCVRLEMFSAFGDGHRYKNSSRLELSAMAALIQWLATNVGNEFIETFLRERTRLNHLSEPEREKEFALLIKQLQK